MCAKSALQATSRRLGIAGRQFARRAKSVGVFVPAASSIRDNRVRERSNFAFPFKLIWAVQSFAQKISFFRIFVNRDLLDPSRPGKRGVSRTSRHVGPVKRWTRERRARRRSQGVLHVSDRTARGTSGAKSVSIMGRRSCEKPCRAWWRGSRLLSCRGPSFETPAAQAPQDEVVRCGCAVRSSW